VSLSVYDRDAITIRDAVSLLAGKHVFDSRGREIDSPREYSTNRAHARGREVHSYGAHFPLFRYVHERGRRPLFLVNGDVWRGNGGSWGNRSRTPDHQTVTRDAIRASGVESCVIPFTALSGAGIALDSVRLIHARPDKGWTETRYAETLAGVPRWNRTVSYSVERTAETLAGVADEYRRVHRKLTVDEQAARDADCAAGRPYTWGYAYGEWGYADRLPDADGLYRWTESRTRPIDADADGRYSWTVHVHRLGDCLFSGVREISEPARPAYPFERGRDTARERVTLESVDGYQTCTAAPDHSHESGAGSACVHCGRELVARAVWRRRARYLSSFDTNESPPLYFLAEVPHGAGDTVETALDALAPRAVHAAIARGAEVLRQGDIFLIPTALDVAALERRGIRLRARLTQWTRDARARRGETGYVPPLSAADRRRMDAIARREYRAARRAGETASAYLLDYGERERRRAESREQWRELLARQDRERDRAMRAGFAPDATAPESGRCDVCGAVIGMACAPMTALEHRYARDDGAERNARLFATRHNREPLADVHAGEREGLRRRTLAGRTRDVATLPAPYSDAGIRRRFANLRADYVRDVALARVALRRATFAEPRPYRDSYGRANRMDPRSRVYAIERARESFERVSRRGAVDSWGNRSPAMARDSYRRAGRNGAIEEWRAAQETARRRLRPELYGERAANLRERVRDAVSIYGTAHTATEVVTLRSGAVYVRGTVLHRPAIERNGDAWRAPDHRPTVLGNGERWYLAVRNTVPRQTAARRRRRPAARVSA